MNGRFNTTVFPPRHLGGLKTNSFCNLFGWGGAREFPRRDRIEVLNSTYCDPDFPQVFCSRFASTSANTCDANAGSPVTCDDDVSTVAGFLLNNNRSCIENGDRFELNFHSVEPFKEWIEKVSSSESIKFSFLILSGFLIILRFFN